jgi:outer membrane protein OmpA-like peptidoglycan-associated protein
MVDVRSNWWTAILILIAGLVSSGCDLLDRVTENDAPDAELDGFTTTTLASTPSSLSLEQADALAAKIQASIDSRDLKVTATASPDGTMTLEGLVPTASQLLSLVFEASRLIGVIQVVDEVRVLEAEAKEAVAEWPEVVGVVEGYHVELTGKIPSSTDQNRMFDDVARIRGIDLLVDTTTVSRTGLEQDLNALVRDDPPQFRSGSARLSPESFAVLDEVVAVLLESAGSVTIEGHTDSRGPADENRILSQARADAVVSYLVEHGIEEVRLRGAGFGEDRLLVTPDNSAEAQSQNRRIEFRVV